MMQTQDVWLYGAIKSCETTIAGAVDDLRRAKELLAQISARLENAKPKEDNRE